MERLLFTPERLANLPEVAKRSSQLFTQWARWPDEAGETLRAQLERVASVVPPRQRRRVLGPLLSTSSSDDQVRGTMHLLLLAKTLMDQGWEVEHEPLVEAGLTPDLRIKRTGEEYLVEVCRVLGAMSGWDKSAPLQDAVTGILTRRPISIVSSEIDGGASLKGFRRHVERLKTGPLPEGRQVFQDRGVLVVYDVHEMDTELPAIIGATSQGHWTDDKPAIREAVIAKLTKYSVPLIVALDLVDLLHPFESVLEAICVGEQHFVIPIDMGTGELVGPSRVEHKPNALVHGKGRDGARARERLLAVLAFECGFGQEPLYKVGMQLIANPAGGAQPFRAFAPIPRWVVVEQTTSHRRMAYLNANDVPLAKKDCGWHHVP